MENTRSMTIVGQGFQRAVSKRAVLGMLFLINLLMTLPLALVFRSALSAIVGDAPAIDELFPGFVYTIFSDLTRVHADAITAFQRMFMPVILASVVVHAIIGVGIVRVMDAHGSVREFFGGIVSFGWRAFRLFLVYMIYGGVLILIAVFLTSIIFGALVKGNATEGSYLIGILIGAVLIGLTLAIVILGSEYSRILVVRENRRSMFKTGLDGLGIVVRHPLRMIGLHGSVFVVLLAVAALYWALEELFGMTSAMGVVIMFIVQQAFILYRLLTRMWNTANGVQFAAVLSDAARPAFVQAPSVHDRHPSFPEPHEKVAERPKRVASGSGGRQKRADGRTGRRRRGRRRGSGTRQGSPKSPTAKKTPPKQKPKPEARKTSGQTRRPRRRRRPPRKPRTNT